MTQPGTAQPGTTRLSVVTAFYNEAINLPQLRKQLEAVLGRMEIPFEIVLVDDHSSDASPQIAKSWAASDRRVAYLRLSRNCGSHAALSAGLAKCRGECAVLLAADLQDPPETISQLLSQWRAGYHVVWAVRAGRLGEPLSRRFFAAVYYGMMRRLGLPEMPASGADFLLIDRKVIDAYNAIPEKHTSLLALILWMGFRQTFVEYVKQARGGGRSKWTLRKKVKLLVDSVTSFSAAPIRAISWLGGLVSVGGLCFALVVLMAQWAGHELANPAFSVLLTVFLVGQGAILVSLGIIGEYLWRAFDEARGRPRYILEECLIQDLALAPVSTAAVRSAIDSAPVSNGGEPSRSKLEITP
jgi:polyisoprenyl-phosphate glycosyltransferase